MVRMKNNSINDLPYYLQIKELIKSKIDKKEYPIGHKLDSENELAETYGVNRMTVRTGIESLVKEGYLKTVPGKGTYVINSPHIEDFKDFDGYKGDISEDNRHILKREIRKAGPYFSHIFKLDENDSLYKVMLLKTLDKEAFSIDYVHIRESEITKLYGFDLKVFSLDEIYKLYDLNISRVVQDLDLVHSNEEVSKHLDLEIGTPIIRIITTKYINDNDVFEYKINYTRPDKCRFINDFSVREEN